MRILLIGVGTVGEAIATLAAERDWCEQLVLADYDTRRATSLSAGLGGGDRFPVERVDARDSGQIVELARRHRSELVMNAVDPQFLMPIFEASLEAGTHYMDMAMSLSRPGGPKLGDEQFARADAWEASGKLALVGMGMDPGLSDVFAEIGRASCRERVFAVV